MKTTKRILSLCIALCMLASSISVFAEYINPYDKEKPKYEYMDSVYKHDMEGFEITEEENEASESESFILLSRLGILDNAYGREAELVNMTDFSVIMSRVKLGAGNALESVYVRNSDESYATYKDALKYLIEALGYYYMCGEFNYSDESLLIVASRIGLINSNSGISNINANITKGDLAAIVVKALTVDMCETTQGSAGFSPSVKQGRNLLNAVHSVYEAEGFVNAIYGMSIYGNGNVRKGHMEINRDDVMCGEYNPADYYGKLVRAYVKRDSVSGTDTVIYMTTDEKNMIYEIDFKDISYMNSQRIEYVDSYGVDRELDISDIKNVSVNGESTASISDIGNPAEADGKIILSASVRNGELDSAVVWKYDYYVIGYNSTSQNRIGYGLGFKDSNGMTYMTIDESKINDVVIDGKASDWKDLKADMIIRVARSAGGAYTQIYAKTETVAAEVSGTDDAAVYIGDKTYYRSKELIRHIQRSKTDTNLIESHRIPEISAGLAGTFYVYDDVLVGFKQGSEFKYAFLKSVQLGRSSIDPSISLRMFTQDEVWVTAEIAGKLILDGVYMTREKALEILKSDASVIKNVVRYSANSENIITELDTIRTTYQEQTSAESTLTEVEGNPHKITYGWTQSYLGEECKYLFDAYTIVFQVPSNMDRESEYKILNNQTVPTASTNNMHSMNFYSANDFNVVKVATWISDQVATGGSISKYVHVERITKVLADADTFEYAYRVYGTQYKDGAARGKGSCLDTSFLVSERLLEYYGIKVGTFLGIAVSGETLTSAKIFSADGVVPDTDYFERWSLDGNNPLNIVGTVKRVDPVGYYMLVEGIDEEGAAAEYVVAPRAMGIIDTAKNVTIPASIDDFAEGDRIMMDTNVGHAGWVFKNLK